MQSQMCEQKMKLKPAIRYFRLPQGSQIKDIFLKDVILTLIIIIVFLNVSCKEEPITPPDNKVKNPREYSWTIDTLSYPGSLQTFMRDIWASSPSDVYVVGSNDQAYGHMFHYDGKNWTAVNLHLPDPKGNWAIELDGRLWFQF